VVIAAICIGCIFAIISMLNGGGKPTGTTPVSTPAASSSVQTTATQSQTGQTTTGTGTKASSSVTTTTASQGATQKYTVVSGDTYYSITIKFYGSFKQSYVDLIKSANSLTSDNLQVGQVLNIPAKP
jgi:LysM repeat protein